jgi:putative Mn2+ efflux pump MntP
MEHTLESRAETESARGGSAASWPAIIAGAFVAASVSLVLLALGSGLGFASISPWPGRGVTATTFAVTTAIWLIAMQWVSSGFGGYITGRLRTRWIGTHTHEVFFRDTAHGLVMWAVATVLVAATFATSLFSAIGSGAHAVSGVASAAASGAASSSANATGMEGKLPGADNLSYGLDKLFRGASPGAGGQASNDPRVEAAHIAANAWSTDTVPDADRNYLAELVAARTGLSPADARARVDEFIAGVQDAAAKVKAEADAVRKTAAKAAIFTALSMLVGAFIASVSAALGGRLRDEHL